MGKLDIYAVNIGAEQEFAAVVGVRSIPTMLFAPMRGNPRMMAGAVLKGTIRRAMQEVLRVEPLGAGGIA